MKYIDTSIKPSCIRADEVRKLTAVAFSKERHAMMVCAPMAARALAVSYPIPVLAPVTRATLPARSTVG